jgi:hypothetical protein
MNKIFLVEPCLHQTRLLSRVSGIGGLKPMIPFGETLLFLIHNNDGAAKLVKIFALPVP